MSPEAPGSLVVPTLLNRPDGHWYAEVDRLDPNPGADSWLRVSWSAATCTGQQLGIGGSIVCAVVPTGFQRSKYPANQLDFAANHLQWRDAAPSEGLMLVVALPEDWVIDSPAAASPSPVDAKVIKGRFATYWMLAGRGRVTFKVSHLQAEAIADFMERFRTNLLDLPRPSPVELQT
ncbi:hypothetical protein [Pseudonocardia charpentierae]|uniref:Uncharacterized protein n=1 Tax=Pseudonocardia charpentierae TaxID=3075545 RepID=A0ABU2NJI7_9PSEU|nr:hypothetical protein [Pseudonocardia sp. DSM 45834]MDT0353875.1 hypothetical protein [Pseudonocardia sp. DSM 45834]